MAQVLGTRIPSGTNTVLFISKGEVPEGRKVTYGRIVDEMRRQKAETHFT